MTLSLCADYSEHFGHALSTPKDKKGEAMATLHVSASGLISTVIEAISNAFAKAKRFFRRKPRWIAPDPDTFDGYMALLHQEEEKKIYERRRLS